MVDGNWSIVHVCCRVRGWFAARPAIYKANIIDEL